MWKIILYSILAGASISLGGTLSITVKWSCRNIKYKEVSNICSAIIFSVGLLLVCCCKLHLYTGKVGVIFEKRQELAYYPYLLAVLLFNGIGSIAIGVGIHYVAKLITKYKTNTVEQVIAAICAKKLVMNSVDDYVSLVLRTLLCGMCVHMAVKCFGRELKPISRIVMLIFWVALFVYYGFEHCIANMFYFAANFSVSNNVFIHIAICIVGNALGTILAVYTLDTHVITKVEDTTEELSTSYASMGFRIHKSNVGIDNAEDNVKNVDNVNTGDNINSNDKGNVGDNVGHKNVKNNNKNNDNDYSETTETTYDYSSFSSSYSNHRV